MSSPSAATAGGAPARPPSTATAVSVAAPWAAMLALLAALWIRTPLSGPGAMFLGWSAPALALTAFSAWWLRRLALPQVRVSAARLGTLLALWTGAAAAALLLTDVAAELALDGLILRRPLERAAGVAIGWVPGLFGLGLCVLGLVAALEARYRITHEEVGDGSDASGALTPSGP